MSAENGYLFPANNRPSLLKDSPSLPALSLSENETAAYDVIGQEDLCIDDIIRRGGLPASAVSVALLGLEMKRLARQLRGTVFVKNR